jgi:gamma-glutamylcysteine synthetase
MDERQFLDPLFNIVKNNQTGAEKLLQKYNNSWDCNINKIFTEDAF